MAQRIQITVSFTTEATISGSTVLLPVQPTTVTVTNRATNQPATVYAGATGTGTIAPVITDAGGNVPGFLPEGSYTIQAAAVSGFSGATVNWEAVYGAGVANVATNAVDTPQLSTALQTQLGHYAPPCPPGSVMHYAGSSDPVDPDGVTRWVICDGRSGFSQTSNPGLWAAIGATYGGSSTNFNVPDMRSRFIVGAQQGGGLANRPLGQYGGGTLDTSSPKRGEETHVLLDSELAQHNHGGATASGTTYTGYTSTDHYHTGETDYTDPVGGHQVAYNTAAYTGWNGVLVPGGGQYGVPYTNGGWPGGAYINHQHVFTTSWQSQTNNNGNHIHTVPNLVISNDGANAAHNNMPPYTALNTIIKVL